ncbi:MAG: MBL fold metallo-hydrolase [Deltaproteobacteria bacterium]|nr:MBL fold metallo-hydrolase [Deltaproteobacteria bacterium]MBW1912082.1 MBL fold metallo-hydrolase [Deltaproteobacteria bacterium]
MEQVSANVYAETGLGGCNPGFVTTKDGIVMIDSPQIPSDAIHWRNEMKNKGEIRYLINTEPHRDHIAGNFFFPGTIIAHQGTREVISSFTEDSIIDRIRNVRPEDLPLMEGYFLKKPDITFSEKLALYLGDHIFELISLPGHTASQIAVYIPQERVVFTGDNVFYRVQTWLKEAVPYEWLQSLERIAQLDVDVIVPGHGEVCDKSYLKEQASFIEEWMETIKEAISQGLSKEEAMERISFLDRYPMDIGLDAIGPEVQRMNVDRLYDLLKES